MLLRLQQFQIDLTDALQRFLELVIVAQPLLHDGFLFRAKAELSGAATWIPDGQNPDWMALTVGTDGTTGAMADEAVEQRAANDLGGEREGGGEFGAAAKDGVLVHLY
ncbi:MAG TPA: hypothetical protein VKB49_08915 [Candidatus Sulfotelmatobacter sp.]|nr:hypothetical protein [Candidatus Sulfotelmatobacter sp.]